MAWNPLRERTTIRREYNKIIDQLQSEGHNVQGWTDPRYNEHDVFARPSTETSPKWTLGLGHPDSLTIHAIPLLTMRGYIEHESTAPEKIAALLERIDKFHAKKILVRPVIRKAKQNLLMLLREFTEPQELKDAQHVTELATVVEQTVPGVAKDKQHKKSMRALNYDINDMRLKRAEILQRIKPYKFTWKNEGSLTSAFKRRLKLPEGGTRWADDGSEATHK